MTAETTTSLPPRGAWIEISVMSSSETKISSLPPRGAWIEIAKDFQRRYAALSLPPRGAWIEILAEPYMANNLPCRSPHGERGLKSYATACFSAFSGRSPHGERGLKCCTQSSKNRENQVAPPTGSVD